MINIDYDAEFLAFKSELRSFLFRLVTNQQDMEDIIQETYLKVSENITTFKSQSSFKTWAFTIAMNIARNHLSKQNRWREDAQDIGARLHIETQELQDKILGVYESYHTTPERKFEIDEHINYCFNCINKTLEISQQVCLLLKEIYHFKVEEIMIITDLSEGKVKHAIADARKNMNRIFEKRCAFINKEGTCLQCSQFKGFLNTNQDQHIEREHKRLQKKSPSDSQDHLLNLRLKIAQEINPLECTNSKLHVYMLENHQDWVEEGLQRNVLG